MSNQSHDPRRPTKAERKEQARLEREAIQRQMAARTRNRTIGLSLVALAVVGAIVAVVVLRPDESADADLPAASVLLDQAAADAGAAGCDEVSPTEPYPDADAAHIEGDERFPELPALDTYPTTPPASGPHTGSAALPAGIYDAPPDMGAVIHSLEHGASVIWYDPDAPSGDLQPIFDFYGQSDPVGQDRVMVAPFDYEGPAGQLPEGVQMSLVAWHRQQSCATPSLSVAFDFTSQLSYPTTEDREYAGEAPERGAAI